MTSLLRGVGEIAMQYAARAGAAVGGVVPANLTPQAAPPTSKIHMNQRQSARLWQAMRPIFGGSN